MNCKSRPLFRAGGTKNSYTSVLVSEKQPHKVSKHFFGSIEVKKRQSRKNAYLGKGEKGRALGIYLT